jgi:predicted metal-dependent enzyme (double-stranded beta helix superfamily)
MSKAVFELDRFIDDVRRARREEAAQPAVAEVLARAVAEPRAVLKALGEPEEAGIYTLYNDAEITVLNVIWAPLMVLLPHNHNMWASIGIYGGREDNIIWRRQAAVIEPARAAALSEREVFSLGPDAVHSVINPIERLTAAIHIYGGDFFAPGRSEWDPESLAERPFDMRRNLDRFKEANRRFHSGAATPEAAG